MAKIEISEAEKQLLNVATMATGEIPKTHVEFGRMLWVAFQAGQIWANPKYFDELIILRKFYGLVREQMGTYFVTFSTKVKSAFDECEKELINLHLIIRKGDDHE